MTYPNVYATQTGPLALSSLDANFLYAVDIANGALSATAGGTADAITATYSPAPAALVAGLTLYVRAASANATTTPQFSPNGLTGKVIVKNNNQALAVGDIAGAGHWLHLVYDATNGVWELMNPATFIGAVQTGGTANGVAYLNASKVLTTGTALTFDGTNFATTGTATATKLIPTGTSVAGNGLYLPAANALGLSTNGTNAVYIDSSQNVGIGTASPAAKLDVRGSSTYLVNATNPTAWVSVDSALTTGSMYNQWNTTSSVGITGTYTNHPHTFVTNNNERMRIDSSGNVGIGTASPSYNLHVKNGSGNCLIAAQYGTGTIGLLTAGSNTVDLKAFNGTNDVLTFTTGASERMRIDSSGNVGIGTSSPGTQFNVYKSTATAVNIRPQNSLAYADFGPQADGSVYGPFATPAASTQLVVGTSNSNPFTFYTNSAERMRIDSSGNVGIGTTSPGAKLQVAGTSGSAQFQAGTAANGYFQINAFDSSTVYCVVGGANATQAVFGSQSNIPTSFFTNNTERMRIEAGGNLLIGYTSSNGSYKLQVNSQIFATSSTIATSDARYKENVEELSGALDIVKSLRPVSFDWKVHPIHNFDTKTKTVGFLAQDVQQTLAGKPYLNSIIKTNECVIEPEVKDENGIVTKEAVTEEFLGIAESNMISILTAAIKELKAEFDAYVIAHP